MGEHKKGWRSGRISDEQSHLLFAHCTSVGPSRIRKAGGLDPKFSEKDVLDDGDWQGTHQFVYAFVSDDPPKGAPKGARTMGWGVAGNYMYTFHQPAGTVYLCHMGVIGRSEIAFPQLIPYQNLTGYKIEKLLTLKPISMKGCCFITTATCEALGLDDDCEELATMRWFRDHVLATNDVGCRAIDEYYEIAPAIVAAIDQTQDSTTIYQDIYFLYLAPAVAAIHQGRHAEASDRYRQLVEMLQLRFGVTR